MATVYAKSAGDWFAANAWNTAADGSGTDLTAPLTAADTADLNGLAMTTTTGTTITQALIQAATGTLTPTGTLTINGPVTYSGTSSAGMIICGASVNLTINSGTVTNSGAGYCLGLTSTAVLSVSNSGNTAVAASNGRAIDGGGSGAISITGDLSSSGGYCLLSRFNHAVTIAGNATVASGTIAAVAVSGGTLSLDGLPICQAPSGPANGAAALRISGGTATWTGSRTINSGVECFVYIFNSGTLNIASLVVALSGRLLILHSGGTLTIGSGATLAQINRQSEAAQAMVFGSAADIVTGPTLPAAGDVDSTAADYGYAGALIEPTCILPAIADVEDGVFYGAGGTEFEGTLDASARILGLRAT